MPHERVLSCALCPSPAGGWCHKGLPRHVASRKPALCEDKSVHRLEDTESPSVISQHFMHYTIWYRGGIKESNQSK